MSTITVDPILHHNRIEYSRFRVRSKLLTPCLLNCYSPKLLQHGRSFCNFKPPRTCTIRASSGGTSTVETSESSTVVFNETYPLKRIEKVEGRICIRLDNGKDKDHWLLTVGCTLPGKWILHWGVTYIDDVGRYNEWDQPPEEMRPPGSISIKDYAMETTMKKSSEEETLHEAKIDVNRNSAIAAINFALKDDETGAWYQHNGRDFKVPLVDNLENNSWPGYMNYMLSFIRHCKLICGDLLTMLPL